MDEGADPVRPEAVAAGGDSEALVVGLALARPETVVARADVLRARATLVEELERLEASTRAAMDVKAKVRRNPGKTAAVVAGTGFVVLGGPRKVLRGARDFVFGKPEPLPKSMLPEEIDRALRAMGDDGARVRGALEHAFAEYLKKDRPRATRFSLVGLRAAVASQALRVGRERVLPRLIDAVTSADPASFEAQLGRITGRRVAGPSAGASSSASGAAANKPPAARKPPAQTW